uniref:Uncharacterized protein n=1 Tax=Rhizophora mucronata TaxID=61149 RepID=A0A2P2QR82_RHIMU
MHSSLIDNEKNHLNDGCFHTIPVLFLYF